MRHLKLALENELCDLAAQVIFLASARVLTHQHQKNKRRSGDKPNVSSEREKRGAQRATRMLESLASTPRFLMRISLALLVEAANQYSSRSARGS